MYHSPRCARAASLFCFLAAFSLTLFSQKSLRGTDYTFTTIVDNQSFFTGISVLNAQSLNDGGEVAFYGESAADFQGVYKSDGSTLTTIATYSQLFLNTGFSGGINDGGSVVFRGDGGSYQRALYVGSGGSLTIFLYENTLDPNPAWVVTGAATINDSNQVAFSGGWISNPLDANPTTRDGFYRVNGPGGSVTVMAETGLGVYSGSSASPPALNDSGQAAFMMRALADNSFQVIRYDDPGVTTIASGFTGSQNVSMNESGDVAFVNQNSTAVQVYHNGSIQTIASTADGFNSVFPGEQFINDVGDVVFAGNVVEYEGNPVNWIGVFDGPDVVSDQVLLFGDTLYGHTVNSLELLGFNDADQILMEVGLSGPENWRGLVLATPVPSYSADFDGDGDVDSDDLDDWQSAYGMNAFADADDDGDSDGRDFLEWQQQYGSGVEPPVDVHAVPEPESIMAVMFGLWAATVRRSTTAVQAGNERLPR